MTPSAEPTSQQADIAAHLVPADLLSGGEIIILAIKPSGWFVLLASLPVVISAVFVAVIAYVVDIYSGWSAAEAVICLCAAIVVIRVTGACWQWLGRTYVLTNLRIVTVRGLVHVRVSAAALAGIRRAELTATIAERLCGAGSVYCMTDSENAPAVAWNTIAHPAEVHEIVMEAIERAK